MEEVSGSLQHTIALQSTRKLSLSKIVGYERNLRTITPKNPAEASVGRHSTGVHRGSPLALEPFSPPGMQGVRIDVYTK